MMAKTMNARAKIFFLNLNMEQDCKSMGTLEQNMTAKRIKITCETKIYSEDQNMDRKVGTKK
jgi:hypothetical protein